MKTYGQYCALARALDRVGQRWTLLVVRELLSGPKRFTDLRAGLEGIATNLLSERLSQLQEDGLVVRRALPPPAASVVYELTESGRALRPVVEELIRWGGRWMVSGAGADAFRAEWLGLALGALGLGADLPEGIAVRIVTPGGALDLVVGGGSLGLHAGADPDLTISGDPAHVLGLAAGALSLEDGLRALDVLPRGERGAALVGRVFSRASATGAAPKAGAPDAPGPPGVVSRTERTDLVRLDERVIRAWAAGDHPGFLAATGLALPGCPEPPPLLGEDLAMIADLAATGGDGLHLLLVLSSGEGRRPLGAVLLLPGEDTSSARIGYSVYEREQGQGYASEAVRAVVDWAFSSGPLERIEATIPPWNAPSIRVAEKLGFRATGLRQDPIAGEVHVFTLTRTEAPIS